MLQSTFILSLLASAVSAQQYGSNPEAPAQSLPHSTSCSTSTPPVTTPCSTSIPATALPSMIYSVEFSASIPIEIQSEIDQPSPSASVYVPISLQFNSKIALAFTSSTAFPTPTYGPVSSSTPCSSTATPTLAPPSEYTTFFSTTIPVEISTAIGVDQPAPSASVYIPASESFDSTRALAFISGTEVPTPTFGPISSKTPCSSKIIPTQTAEKSTITVFPTPVAESTKSKATITVFPTPVAEEPTKGKSTITVFPTPVAEESSKSKATITVFPTPVATQSTKTESKATITVLPNQSSAPKPKTTLCTKTKGKPTITVFPSPTGKPSRPSSSTPAGESNQSGPGYGPARPRYSAWHAAPEYKPKPSAGAAKVSSKPCTLQTKVRPTATPAAGGY